MKDSQFRALCSAASHERNGRALVYSCRIQLRTILSCVGNGWLKPTLSPVLVCDSFGNPRSPETYRTGYTLTRKGNRALNDAACDTEGFDKRRGRRGMDLGSSGVAT